MVCYYKFRLIVDKVLVVFFASFIVVIVVDFMLSMLLRHVLPYKYAT